MEVSLDRESATVALTTDSHDTSPTQKIGPMYLFIDTETTGLPRNWHAPVDDTDNWPRLVQIAWALYDAAGRHMATTSFIVRPEGFDIPGDAQRIHGISTAKAMAEGTPITTVVRALANAARNADILLAHNLQFDEKVVAAEFLRQGLAVPFAGMQRRCTMVEGTDFCRLPGPRGFKWPSLAELHTALFGKGFPDRHDATADVLACAKCFFELQRRGAIKSV